MAVLVSLPEARVLVDSLKGEGLSWMSVAQTPKNFDHHQRQTGMKFLQRQSWRQRGLALIRWLRMRSWGAGDLDPAWEPFRTAKE